MKYLLKLPLARTEWLLQIFTAGKGLEYWSIYFYLSRCITQVQAKLNVKIYLEDLILSTKLLFSCNRS